MANDLTCSVEHCDKVRAGRLYCPMHYQRMRLYGSLDLPERPAVAKKKCSVDGCARDMYVHKMCRPHAERWKKYGDPHGEYVPPKHNGVDLCLVDGCDRISKAYRMCVMHSTRFARYGDPLKRAATKFCVVCGTPFVGYGRQVCCTVHCRKELVILCGGSERRRARLAAATVENFSRAEVFERDRWTCGICQGPINRESRFPAPDSVSLDHIVPLAMGGEHSRANCQTAHLLCNTKKGARVAQTREGSSA